MPTVGAFSTTLPVTAVSASTPMPMPATSFGSAPAARNADQVADHVALHDGQPPALVEVGDGDAERRAVDHVVGDHRALEAELGVERDLAQSRAGIADDLQVRRGIAAHGRERGAADAVAAHDDVAGAEHLMALPFWPEPPSRAAMSSMRLSMTSVPSSPACERHTRMPLLPAPRTVLPASLRPRASSEKMPAPAAPVTVEPVTSPSHRLQHRRHGGPRRRSRNRRSARRGRGRDARGRGPRRAACRRRRA